MSKKNFSFVVLIFCLLSSVHVFAAPVNGAWTSSLSGSNLLLVLQERADGRIIGYVSGQRGTQISGGTHSGTSVSLTISHTDPGSSGSGTFSGTLSGSTISGTYTEGSSSTAMVLTKTTSSYKTENWLFTNSGSSVQDSFGRVKNSTGSFDSGSFVGVSACTFLACGGTVSSWTATAGSHSIATSSGGSCASTSSLAGTFNTSSRLLSGTFSTTNCTTTTSGSFSAVKTGLTGVAGTRSVLQLLSSFADAIETESTSSINSLFTPLYMNNGTTKNAAIAELTTVFSNYSSLSVAINGVEEVTTENDSEVHTSSFKGPRVKWSMTVTGIPTSSTTPTTVATLNSDETNSTYYWIKLSSGTATFSGNGQFELQTPYTDIAGVSNAHPFVTSASSTTPGDRHNGIDFMHNSPSILTIRAAAGGIVQADSPVAPWLNTNGYQVNIRVNHSDTKYTEMAFETFSTVSADGTTQASSAYIPVSNGTAVEAGDVIGILYVPVSTSSAHVHFGFYENSTVKCPSPYFSSSARSEILGLIQIWDSTATSLCKVE